MARLDIEDQFFLDLMGVIEKMGDQDRAAGNALRFLRYSQEKHRKGKLLSEDEFRARGFDESLIGIFAERVEGGIQAVGARKHFGWLDKKIAAGSKGGRSKTEAKTKHLKQNKAKGSNTEPTPTLSPSLSSTSTDTNSHKLHPPVAAESSKELRSEIWDRYSNAFFNRYKTDPVRNASVNSKIKLLAERLGDEAKDVVEFYVTHNNAFYVRSTHSIGLCLQDAEGLRTQWATGRMTSQKEAQQADSSTALATQLKKIREGSL